MFFVTALTSGFALGPWDLMASRFFGGVAVGVSSIAAPVYIAEISPPERRGMLGGLFQINIIVGMIAS
jgi:MFS family permease